MAQVEKGDPYRSPNRPRLPYVVFDQACLRDEGLVNEAAARAKSDGELIALTEPAFFELMKSKSWEAHYRDALLLVARHPETVIGARSIAEMKETERETGIPQWDVLDERWTPILRQHLTNLQTGPDRLMEASRLYSDDLRARLFSQSFYERNKAALKSMVNGAEKQLPARFVKQFKQGNRQALVDFLGRMEIARLCVEALEYQGYPRDFAMMLAHEPSMSGYYYYCTLALTLKWVFFGGIDSFPAQRLSNDSLDMDYIVTGLFCKKIVSKDTKMIWINDVLNEALDNRWITFRGHFERLGRGRKRTQLVEKLAASPFPSPWFSVRGPHPIVGTRA